MGNPSGGLVRKRTIAYTESMTSAQNGTRMVGYVRVSTQRQSRSGLGLADQQAKITAAAEREGWTITEWAIDRGETGKNTARPEFKRALELIADGAADGMISAKLDRLARSTIDFAQLLGWFSDGGKALVVLDPAVDTTTASGRLVASIFSALSEWEADLISERTSAALQAKRASGLAICRASVADDPELVAKIETMRAEGLSLRAIADRLSAEGVPTLRGASVWQVSAVQAALGYKRPKTHKAANLPTIRRQRQTRKAG